MQTPLQPAKIQVQIKRSLGFFILALFISGLTAIPIQEQLEMLLPYTDSIALFRTWFQHLHTAVVVTKEKFPVLFYGLDWLAFAHFMLAILFIGPYKNPVKNKWVIQFGMISCLCVIPYAMVFGYIRQIPFWWRLMDCSFGIFGYALLKYVYEKIKLLETKK